MRVNRSVSISFCFAILLGGAAWFADPPHAAQANQKVPDQLRSWDRINQAARNVKIGDASTARALVDEVFAHHGIDSVATAETIKDRLASAEIAYQGGESPGLSEGNVVNAVNDLARRFNAPPYAYTDVSEVRQVRLRMLTLYPAMMGRGPAATRDDSKPHFDKGMSPIEAFHTSATLVYQKIFNPEFQLTAQELQSDPRLSNSGHSAISSGRFAVARGSMDGKRTRKVLNAIREGAASMSIDDMLDQSSRFLDLLGVRR